MQVGDMVRLRELRPGDEFLTLHSRRLGWVENIGIQEACVILDSIPPGSLGVEQRVRLETLVQYLGKDEESPTAEMVIKNRVHRGSDMPTYRVALPKTLGQRTRISE